GALTHHSESNRSLSSCDHYCSDMLSTEDAYYFVMGGSGGEVLLLEEEDEYGYLKYREIVRVGDESIYEISIFKGAEVDIREKKEMMFAVLTKRTVRLVCDGYGRVI
ncbi:hypothetical protein PFISCL1PPCAC_20801, partial [Pristionchus fissidentatus]